MEVLTFDLADLHFPDATMLKWMTVVQAFNSTRQHSVDERWYFKIIK